MLIDSIESHLNFHVFIYNCFLKLIKTFIMSFFYIDWETVNIEDEMASNSFFFTYNIIFSYDEIALLFQRRCYIF